LQLSRNPSFTGELGEYKLPAVTRMQVTLEPGEWHWRLASLNKDGESRSYSPPRNFLVQPLPKPPEQISGKAIPGQAIFAWSAASGVARYGFELRNGLGATMSAMESATSNVIVEGIKAGRYSWRVRSLEADGKAGEWGADHPIIVPPFPPKADGPEDGKRLLNPELVLSWTPVEGALGYRLQISDKPDMTRPQTELRLTSNAHIWNVPQPGVWYWRVAALGEANVSSGYAPTRTFRYQPLPPKVEGLTFVTENKQIVATWKGKSAKYRVEFSKEPGFSDLLSKQDVVTNEARIDRPPRGKYWVRVTPFDAEGEAGPVSDAIRLEVRQAFWELLTP
jgi:hypothetical protein